MSGGLRADRLNGVMSRRRFGAATAAAGGLLVLPGAAHASPDVRRQTESARGRVAMEPGMIIRISIARCDAEQFDKLRQMMSESEAALRPGIERMPGHIAFYAGADPATYSLTNTSLWDTLEHAQQLDGFEPMLHAGQQFAAAGARFERPIMNYASLWRFGGLLETQR